MKRAARWCNVRVLFLCWLGAFVVGMSGASAQPALTGYVKFYHHNRFEESSQITRTGARLQLTVAQALGDRGALFGSIDFDVNEVHGRDRFFEERGAQVDIYPVELYVDLYWDWLDLRLGKQFVFWGKTEWINPTDNINPWDYANISAEIEDYRLPVTALRADMYLGETTLEAVWVPAFLPHRVPGLVPRTVQVPGGPLLVWREPELPEGDLRNSQFGLRLMHTLAGVDWSVSYYRGNDHSPSYRQRVEPAQAGPPTVELTPYFPRLQVLGADLQKVFGQWGVRAEGAWFRTADPDGDDVLVPNPHLQGVATLDYTPTDRLALALQGVVERQLRYDEAWETERRREIGLGVAQPRTLTSVSGRLRWQPADYWTAQLIGVWNTQTKDRFVLLFVNYQPADALNLTLGGVFFGGAPDTPFGRMRQQDRLFVEVKASF